MQLLVVEAKFLQVQKHRAKVAKKERSNFGLINYVKPSN